MPKMKTKKAAAKRFRITGSGKLVRKQGFRQHDAWGKSKKQRRHLRKQVVVNETDQSRSKRMFPGQL